MAYQASERIYVDHAHTRIVPEDHPEGAVLLVAEGGFLTDEDADAWGLAGDAAAPGEAPDRPSPEQAAANAQTLGANERKAIRGSRNKALTAPEATKAGADAPSVHTDQHTGLPLVGISGADAPVPDLQPTPKDLTAPGS